MVTTRSFKQNITRSQADKATPYWCLEDDYQPKKKRTHSAPIVFECTAPVPTQSMESDADDECMSICSEESEISIESEISEVESLVDFDDAREAWGANKRRGPNGTYQYLCMKIMGNGRPCPQVCCDKIGLYSGCKRHYMWEEKAHKYEDIQERKPLRLLNPSHIESF